MPETDAYEWASSNMPQDIMRKTPFSNVQFNFINDINSGIYNNSSLSLVQFDLSSLYNSATFSNTKSHFILIPLVRVAEAFSALNANIALTNDNYYLTSLKNLNTCLIHQADLLLNGKTVHQLTPFSNMAIGVKLMSQLSKDDLALMGAEMGILAPDNPFSMTYKLGGGTDGYSTPSIANNYVNGTPYPNIEDSTTPQGSGIANGAIQLKTNLNKCVAGSFSSLYELTGSQEMDAEFQPTFETLTTGGKTYAIWKDYAVIFLKDVLDAMDKIGLVRRLDGILRLYINTGFVGVQYSADGKQLTFNGATTFTDTCPIMINNNGVAPAVDVRFLNVGLFIAKTPTSSFTNSTAVSTFPAISSPMNACRYYFNQITIQPSLALDYISSNSSKKIIYDGLLYNTFVNITAKGNFSQLIQSGCINIKSVMIIPLVSATVAGFSAYKSPFDPVGSGGCSHPISLINFQVQIGGANQLATSLYYTYENFIEQMSKFNKQSTSEYGVESGLISKEFWNNNRVYLVNVRSTEDDLNTPRNIVISFLNNSKVAIDILVFVVYEDTFVLNVATGLITK